MLSAGAYSFRQKSRLAISLSWIGGYTNVITLLFCGMATSHMTGNVTHLGQSFSEGNFSEACFFGWVLICFVLGAGFSGALLELARWHNLRSRYALPLACEAILLSVFSMGVNWRLWQSQHYGRPLVFWRLSSFASFSQTRGDPCCGLGEVLMFKTRTYRAGCNS